MLSIDECFVNTNRWVACDEGCAKEKDFVDDINPEDRISNISKQSSHGSYKSGRSSLKSFVVRKGSTCVSCCSFTSKYNLNEQEVQLRRKREQLDLETKIAASTAKLAVLQALDENGSSNDPTNEMLS